MTTRIAKYIMDKEGTDHDAIFLFSCGENLSLYVAYAYSARKLISFFPSLKVEYLYYHKKKVEMIRVELDDIALAFPEKNIWVSDECLVIFV